MAKKSLKKTTDDLSFSVMLADMHNTPMWRAIFHLDDYAFARGRAYQQGLIDALQRWPKQTKNDFLISAGPMIKEQGVDSEPYFTEFYDAYVNGFASGLEECKKLQGKNSERLYLIKGSEA